MVPKVNLVPKTAEEKKKKKTNYLKTKLALGTKLGSFENPWTWLMLTQTSRYVSGIYLIQVKSSSSIYFLYGKAMSAIFIMAQCTYNSILMILNSTQNSILLKSSFKIGAFC